MNHIFKGAADNPATCVKCSKDVIAHSEYATCEVCKKFPCVVNIDLNDYLSCEECEKKEMDARVELGNRKKELPDTIKRLEAERFDSPAAQVDKLVTSNIKSVNGNSPLTDLPQTGDEFFNAETISHIELEKRVMANESIPQDKKWFDFMSQLQVRHEHLRKTLAEGVSVINEIRSRISSVQRSQNMLSSKLRADEKAKLKIADINYIPVKAPKKVKARMTESDKLVESIAKTFAAPRNKDGKIMWDELTQEQREECLVKGRQIYVGNMSSINSAAKIVDAGNNAASSEEKDNEQ